MVLKSHMAFVVGLGLMFVFFMPHPIYGHGLGSEILPPVKVGDKHVALEISVQPSIYDLENSEQWITIRFFDAKTDGIIENVTYLVELKKDGNQIFKEMFYDELGNLSIRTITNNSGEVEVQGTKESTSGAWVRDKTTPLTLKGHIFTSGGLYEFNVEILSYDSLEYAPKQQLLFNGAISIAEKTLHNVVGDDEKKHQLGLTTYYDKISGFEYSSDAKEVSFRMPFDWSTENIDKTSVVHEELHIPKSFAELLATKYEVSINSVPLSENSIIPDDFSFENERIVHIIIPKENLTSMKNSATKLSSSEMIFSITPSQEITFPVSHKTFDQKYDVDLSWEPSTIKSGQITKFTVSIRESFVPNSDKSIPYDLILDKDGNEIFREDTITDPSKNGAIHQYTFSEDDVGTINMRVENIDGDPDQFAEFVIIVGMQESPIPNFPIRLASSKLVSNELIDGNYWVDITWFPSTLKIFSDSEFIITIYDKKTDLPIPQAEYDFVLLKDNNEIYRTSGIAKGGGTFENYRFAEQDLGNIQLRIENIDQSNEFVEIPINVVPELSGSLVVYSLVFGCACMIILSSKFKIKMSL